jgi:hypothetical protein
MMIIMIRSCTSCTIRLQNVLIPASSQERNNFFKHRHSIASLLQCCFSGEGLMLPHCICKHPTDTACQPLPCCASSPAWLSHKTHQSAAIASMEHNFWPDPVNAAVPWTVSEYFTMASQTHQMAAVSNPTDCTIGHSSQPDPVGACHAVPVVFHGCLNILTKWRQSAVTAQRNPRNES